MTSTIDHLAVTAVSLESGELDELLGVPLSPGGSHARMGTHNRLLRLGAGAYLELIAVDPKATKPGRPRWFELDDPAMQARLARGPRLVHWVARVGSTHFPSLPFDVGPWEPYQRGDLSWQHFQRMLVLEAELAARCACVLNCRACALRPLAPGGLAPGCLHHPA